MSHSELSIAINSLISKSSNPVLHEPTCITDMHLPNANGMAKGFALVTFVNHATALAAFRCLLGASLESNIASSFVAGRTLQVAWSNKEPEATNKTARVQTFISNNMPYANNIMSSVAPHLMETA
jgi:hypothetical protein